MLNPKEVLETVDEIIEIEKVIEQTNKISHNPTFDVNALTGALNIMISAVKRRNILMEKLQEAEVSRLLIYQTPFNNTELIKLISFMMKYRSSIFVTELQKYFDEQVLKA